MCQVPRILTQLSIDWFKGKITGKSNLHGTISGVRLRFSIFCQPIETHPIISIPKYATTKLESGMTRSWGEINAWLKGGQNLKISSQFYHCMSIWFICFNISILLFIAVFVPLFSDSPLTFNLKLPMRKNTSFKAVLHKGNTASTIATSPKKLKSQIEVLIWYLVGGFNPSEKY